jgi:Immunity protein 21
MKWISSAGGPLICADEGIAFRWKGIKGTSDRSAPAGQTDYERACASAMAEYIGKIMCDDGEVLVLGDEPAQSSFFTTSKGELAIARWIYSDPAASKALLPALAGEITTLSDPIPFTVQEDKIVLFDASTIWVYDSEACASITSTKRKFYVTTEKLNAFNERSQFIIHRFINI